MFGARSAPRRGMCTLHPLCPGPALLVLHSLEGSVLCGSSQGGCLGSESGWGWTVQPLGFYAHHEDVTLGHEAKTAMSVALAIVPLTKDHIGHVADALLISLPSLELSGKKKLGK